MKNTLAFALFALIGLHPGAFAPQAVNIPSGALHSSNWSGYVASSGTFTSVGASWTVPPSSAASGTISADATWVGIGGSSRHDLIQAGTQTVFQDGTPSYEAWYELLPGDSVRVPLTVHPGDAMTVSMAETSAGQWQLSFNDATTGQSYQTSTPYTSSHSSAEWIEEMSSGGRGFVPLDNFGAVSFTSGFSVRDGARAGILGSGAQPMTMITNSGQTLATPSALGSDGASFTVTRSTASAAVPATAFRRGYGWGHGRWGHYFRYRFSRGF